MYFRFEVKESSERLDLFLSKTTQKSRSLIKSQIQKLHVKVNGSVIDKPSHEVRPGDAIEANFQYEEKELTPIAKDLDILYEDSFLLVLNKPQGMVVHPAPSHKGETLVHYLLHHLKGAIDVNSFEGTRPGIVHRLDKGTSGCLIIAKTRGTLEKLSVQFKNREIQKVYRAVVFGKMTGRGVVKNEIGRDLRTRTKMSSRTQTGRISETAWEVLSSFPQFSEVKLFPKTGRTHQLRVHMSELHHPIVGDDTYGGQRSRNNNYYSEEVRSFLEGIQYPFLHAAELEFTHPELNKKMRLESRLPSNYQQFLRLLTDQSHGIKN